MNWKDYLCSTDLIRTTIPTLSGGIDKKHKKCHNGPYRCEDSNHAPPDYKPEPICSANSDKRLQQQHIENHNVEVTKQKKKKIFENILTQSCVLVPYMMRVMWSLTKQHHQHSRRMNIQYIGKFQAYSQVSNSHTGSVVETTDNTDRKAMYHAPLFKFLET